MENPTKKSLEKLLELIDDLCSIDENQWFKKKLEDKYSITNGFENFPEFLKHQKNQFKLKGRHFYSEIKDEKLKQELIDDYVEMAWYQSINNVSRFVLFAFYQMENLLNYYAIISRAYRKIEANKDYFSYTYNGEKGSKFKVVTYDNFFYKNKKNKIEKVSIWAKVTFWMIDSGSRDWEKKNHLSISNMINIRNDSSHRSSNNTNNYSEGTIAYLKKSDFSSLGFYVNIIRKITESIQNIDPKIKIYENKKGSPIIKKPIIVGKIDLEKTK